MHQHEYRDVSADRQVIWARSQDWSEVKSYSQLVLGHKSVTFEKEADVVLRVSEVKGKKLFHLLPFTVEKSSLLIPRNLTLSSF